MGAQNRRRQKNWALDLDDIAEDYYREYWDDITDIVDVEGEHDVEDMRKIDLGIEHVLDLFGADKLVVVDGQRPRVVILAQRFRPFDSGDDFSLRIKTWGHASEYEKYVNGIQNQGAYPNVYAFGNANEDGDGFENFYLIDFQFFLQLTETNKLRGRSYDTGDGTKARYYKIEDLKRKGCVLESWE